MLLAGITGDAPYRSSANLPLKLSLIGIQKVIKAGSR